MPKNIQIDDPTPKMETGRFRGHVRSNELYDNHQLYDSHTPYYEGKWSGIYPMMAGIEEVVPVNYLAEEIGPKAGVEEIRSANYSMEDL